VVRPETLDKMQPADLSYFGCAQYKFPEESYSGQRDMFGFTVRLRPSLLGRQRRIPAE